MKTYEGRKLMINDASKVVHVKQEEYSFQYQQVTWKITPITHIVKSVIELDNVSLQGKAIHLGDVTEVGTKTLKLVEAIFSDTSGSIIVDIWKEHIPLIKCGNVFLLDDMHVRILSGIKKVLYK